MNTLMDKALDDATRAEDIVKVAQKELPVVESVINDGQDTLKSLDAFFARNDETLDRAPGTIKNNLIAMQTGLNGAAAITDFLKIHLLISIWHFQIRLNSQSYLI